MWNLVKLPFLALLIACSLRAALLFSQVPQEPDAGEIASLAEQLGSSDAAVVRRAAQELRQVKTEAGVAAMLEAVAKAPREVRTELYAILGEIGEPAVAAVFDAEVCEDPPSGRWAGHVLTSYLRTTAVPHLLERLQTGKAEERKVAAWALKQITHYYGLGEVPPAEAIPILFAVASKDEVQAAKQDAAEALCNIKDPSSIPALIKLLADSDQELLRDVCSRLGRFGPVASPAAPVLRRGLKDGALPAEALDALVAIEGKPAVPFVVQRWQVRPRSWNDDSAITSALLRAPHPSAIPIMKTSLWKGESSSRVRAALFFERLDHPESVKELRKCLSVHPPESSEQLGPLHTAVAIPSNLRTIAIRGLAQRRDRASYEAMLRLLRDDPSVNVRTAAANAMGVIRYAPAVPALRKQLLALDQGHSASGHKDGELHQASIGALAALGTTASYRVLYEGTVEGHAQRLCIAFWRDAKDRKVFARFLEFFEDEPIRDEVAAGILAQQLGIHRKYYLASKKDFPAVKAQFLANVLDAKRFGPDADLSNGGAHQVSLTVAVHTVEYVVVTFTFSSTRARGFGHGYRVVYRKDGVSWIPMAEVNRWVT